MTQLLGVLSLVKSYAPSEKWGERIKNEYRSALPWLDSPWKERRANQRTNVVRLCRDWILATEVFSCLLLHSTSKSHFDHYLGSIHLFSLISVLTYHDIPNLHLPLSLEEILLQVDVLSSFACVRQMSSPPCRSQSNRFQRYEKYMTAPFMYAIKAWRWFHFVFFSFISFLPWAMVSKYGSDSLNANGQ